MKKREIQNVKRRAYDALTVLISCGIFQKDGKDIKAKTGSAFLLRSNYF